MEINNTSIPSKLDTFIKECIQDDEDRPRFLLTINASPEETKKLTIKNHTIVHKPPSRTGKVPITFETINSPLFFTRCRLSACVPIAQFLRDLLGHSNFILTEISPFSVFSHF